MFTHQGSVLVIVDRDKAPDVAVLQAAKAAGVKVAFSSGGTATSTRRSSSAACRPSRPRAWAGRTSGCRASPDAARYETLTISRLGPVVIGAAPRIVRSSSLVSCAAIGLEKK